MIKTGGIQLKNKKLYILITLIIIIIVSGSLFTQHLQRKNISLKLMNEYLNNYKSTVTEKNRKLSNYRIEKIKDIKSSKKGFTFSVVYSVKPVDDNSYWLAGNGKVTSDGWIINKYIEVTVVKEGNKYIIESMGIA